MFDVMLERRRFSSAFAITERRDIGETIRNIFVCVFIIIVECYESVECGWRCSVGYTMYGLATSVCWVCDHCVPLDTPSICFDCVCVCRKLSPHSRV